MQSLREWSKNVVKSTVPPGIVRWTLPANAKRSILFTFDDGPDIEFTSMVLDLLKDHGARAIFFVVGDRITTQNEHLLRRVIDEGHALGNHSFSHAPENGRSVRHYKNELLNCQQRIVEACDVSPIMFRPPRGALSFSALLAARALGLKVILWSRGSGEFDEMKGRTSQQMSDRLARSLRARDIVLMHDTTPEVPAVLNKLLPVLRADGIDLANGLDSLIG